MLMMMISLGLTLLYSTLSIRIDQRSSRDSTQSVKYEEDLRKQKNPTQDQDQDQEKKEDEEYNYDQNE
ncbi:hypothetical protein MJO28_011706 [Puccinia striiformis f. sp. tritici]|uniref:Uncharacterized protein n=1 Tax=Puccinia striiformis f. sp. tritici TaxID=168172 RepID=A0ACC0E4U7_9BASI|nr:hypothetical protein MJO28_011706 [Puccinia striiformis f. sp. tritici]